MTNRQWLMEQMQNMSDEELGDFISECILKQIQCHKTCEHKYPYRPCKSCKLNWLKAEHKEPIKLSDAERVILENIDKNYKWIAREYDGAIVIYFKKPVKDDNYGCWDTDNEVWCCFEAFNHLFQFIKWEDTNPYKIEELLK